jgi:YVTN family beta-propeller protein
MNARRNWAAALACVLGMLTGGVQAAGETLAYVANFEANTVTVIDTATHAVVATVPVGPGPFGVAARPDGRFVYVTNNGGTTVSVIDTASNSVAATVPVGMAPAGIAPTPDGRFVYAVALGDGLAYAIDTTTNAVARTAVIGVTGPVAIAFGADGRFAYVANSAVNTVSVLDAPANGVVAMLPVGELPYDVAVTPDGRFAYVVNLFSTAEALSVIDTASNAVVAGVALEEGSQGLAIHPGGRFVYVTNGPTNTLAVVDTASNTRVATIQTGTNPVKVAVTPDGRFAYVTNQDSASVSVIDTAGGAAIASVPVGLVPQGVAFAKLPIDEAAPVTAAAASPAPNAAGWSNQPVAVTLSASDSSGGSGVQSIAYTVANGSASSSATVEAASASFVLSGDGVNTITYAATDKAGNAEPAKTLVVRIDRTAAASAASASPPPAANGANATPVTVTVTATDAPGGSGVQSISVLRTTGTSTTGETFPGASATFVVSAQGTTTVAYQAIDAAGNAEPSKTLVVRIESAPAPAFSASVSVSPAVLWPPDRRFDSVQARVKSANAVGRVRIKSVSVASDERVGRHPDWIVNGSSVKLRAEREDRGNGRVYTLTYTLVDEAGNTTIAVDTVKVPRYWPQWHWGHWDDRRHR